MASIATAAPAESPIEVITESTSSHAVPAGRRLRLGRAITGSDGLNWTTFSIIAVFHIGAVAALFFFSWQRLAVMAILYVLAINVGIGMCYHRLLTHRGYTCPKWVEYVMKIGRAHV